MLRLAARNFVYSGDYRYCLTSLTFLFAISLTVIGSSVCRGSELKSEMSQIGMFDIARERSYDTPLKNSTLLPLLLFSMTSQKLSPTTETTFRRSYDYIVVGAGSAGSVMANRLSEVSCVSVLLLEAGSVPPVLADIPQFGGGPFLDTEIDWQFRTVPQKYTGGGFVNRRIHWPRGKALGGTSVLHGNQYFRGNRKNYDDWAAAGAAGWSYDEVLPYFKKSEDNLDHAHNKYHGVGGPMTVTFPKYRSEMRDPLFEAYKEQGYLKNPDSNGAFQIGPYDQQGTLRNGQRCSTAKAYLVPAENRPNLDIITNARVVKVVIRNNRATGVLFDNGLRRYFVRASREVIASAGSTNTPHLLMLSGIGPEQDLRSFGIPVVADLPVGFNLHDHCETLIGFELSSNIESLKDKLKGDNCILTYINNRSGILAATAGIAMGSFLKSTLSEDPAPDVPDFQIYFHESDIEGIKKSYGLTNEVYNQVYVPYENKTIATCQAILLTPLTRGRIKLQSNDPYDAPEIDLQYLENPSDLERFVEGMKICQRLGTSQAMREIGCRPFSTRFPGCEHLAGDEDGYFRCQAGLIASTNHHHVGTAKMGRLDDPTTVVDPQLRVKSIDGLRVVDASVIPTIPTGNTNVPIIMIAEKAADMIKETIACRQAPEGHNAARTFASASARSTAH